VKLTDGQAENNLRFTVCGVLSGGGLNYNKIQPK